MRGAPEEQPGADAQFGVGDEVAGEPPGQEPVQGGRGQQHGEGERAASPTVSSLNHSRVRSKSCAANATSPAIGAQARRHGVTGCSGVPSGRGRQREAHRHSPADRASPSSVSRSRSRSASCGDRPGMVGVGGRRGGVQLEPGQPVPALQRTGADLDELHAAVGDDGQLVPQHAVLDEQVVGALRVPPGPPVAAQRAPPPGGAGQRRQCAQRPPGPGQHAGQDAGRHGGGSSTASSTVRRMDSSARSTCRHDSARPSAREPSSPVASS